MVPPAFRKAAVCSSIVCEVSTAADGFFLAAGAFGFSDMLGLLCKIEGVVYTFSGVGATQQRKTCVGFPDASSIWFFTTS